MISDRKINNNDILSSSPASPAETGDQFSSFCDGIDVKKTKYSKLYDQLVTDHQRQTEKKHAWLSVFGAMQMAQWQK